MADITNETLEILKQNIPGNQFEIGAYEKCQDHCLEGGEEWAKWEGWYGMIAYYDAHPMDIRAIQDDYTGESIRFWIWYSQHEDHGWGDDWSADLDPDMTITKAEAMLLTEDDPDSQ